MVRRRTESVNGTTDRSLDVSAGGFNENRYEEEGRLTIRTTTDEWVRVWWWEVRTSRDTIR